MRVLLSGGGTGGHVYPGLAVAAALTDAGTDPEPQAGRPQERLPVELLWLGSTDGLEGDLVRREGVPFRGIVVGGVHGLSLKRMAINSAKMAQGLVQAWQVIGQLRPQACFVTGGYVSVPVALVAWVRGVPVLVYLPDIEPGQAVRFISRFARRVAVTAEDSRAYFPSRKVVVTGYPIRPELWAVDRDEARRRLGLDSELPVLLVMGGSRGARPINQALAAALDELLPACEIVHLSGHLDADWVAHRADELAPDLRARYHPHAYLHSDEVAQAMGAADLVVARAGAATMAEFPAMGLPSILVPYPHYWRYQRVNADYMVRSGAAIQVEDARLAADLSPTVRRLLDDPEERRWMGERAQALARPDAAQRIARELLQLGSGRRA